YCLPGGLRPWLTTAAPPGLRSARTWRLVPWPRLCSPFWGYTPSTIHHSPLATRHSPIIRLVPTRVGRGAGRAVPGGGGRVAAGAVVGPRADRVADEPAGERVIDRRRGVRRRHLNHVFPGFQIDVAGARRLARGCG